MLINKPKPWHYRWWAIMLFIFLIIITGNLLSRYSQTDKEYVPTIYRAKGDYFIAVSEEVFKNAREYKINKDTVALAKLLAEGKIFYLRPGTEVYRLDVTLTGIVKIRPKGYTEELWTYREEIY